MGVYRYTHNKQSFNFFLAVFPAICKTECIVDVLG